MASLLGSSTSPARLLTKNRTWQEEGRCRGGEVQGGGCAGERRCRGGEVQGREGAGERGETGGGEEAPVGQTEGRGRSGEKGVRVEVEEALRLR